MDNEKNVERVASNNERPMPPYHITDPEFEWVPAAKTDVTRIWRKYGWVPPSELRKKEGNE